MIEKTNALRGIDEWPFPAIVWLTMRERDADERTRVYMMIQKAIQHPNADTFFASIAIAVMFKGLIKQCVNLLFDDIPGLYLAGR